MGCSDSLGAKKVQLRWHNKCRNMLLQSCIEFQLTSLASRIITVNSRAYFPYRELMSFCNTSEHPVPAVELWVKQVGRKVSVISPTFFQPCAYILLHGKSFHLQITLQFWVKLFLSTNLKKNNWIEALWRFGCFLCLIFLLVHFQCIMFVVRMGKNIQEMDFLSNDSFIRTRKINNKCSSL